MMTPEQREQLEFIQRCDPTFLIMHVRERTMFDAKLLERVFELAKDQARSLVGTPAAPKEDWTDVDIELPNDERQVLVFLNGHCGLLDTEARKGGGWGIRPGFYDHDKRYFRVYGSREQFVTHWQDMPAPPASAKGAV
ncbi:DUF551 domain-containing protein [Paraburkholderia sp.]|uniref:DUF551 domain-containing protein n=1 Tax=Paraburkholderia sp. TaxID=1926495 RepID=UPI0039E6AF30